MYLPSLFTPLRICERTSTLATNGMRKPSPVGRDEAQNHLIDVEQRSFKLILLKVLATKGESMLMPSSQIGMVTTYLENYEKDFIDNAKKTLGAVHLGGRDKEYVSAVETYTQSAHKLLTPVNIWMIPYPTGHAAMFASPTKLSLVATNA